MQTNINNLEGSVEFQGITVLNKCDSVEIIGCTELAFSLNKRKINLFAYSFVHKSDITIQGK